MKNVTDLRNEFISNTDQPSSTYLTSVGVAFLRFVWVCVCKKARVVGYTIRRKMVG
jgi:hypothetical protein